jgi:FKBP-type peptidyl-prolyl cis-trans isomerase SlyD
MSGDLKVMDGQVVSMDYNLHIDGQLVDSSKGGDPLDYLHGAGNIIPGLESELDGMAVGESKRVIVSPADGYGEHDPEAYMEVPRGEFPAEIPLEIGTQLQLQNEDGHPMYARIDEINDDTVVLDFNHPLAGKELHFDVTIVAVREPTTEELDHGHVHHGHEH